MIIRAWQGWTIPDRADDYEGLLREEIFPDIQSKTTQGLRSIELLRRDGKNETEFMTLLRFYSVDDIETLVGVNTEVAYVPDSARLILHRYEDCARHFESRYECNVRSVLR